MTQRIYELFEQTLKEFKQEHKYATYIVPDPIKEKFAELIVKECAEWIKNTDSDPDIGEEDAKALLEHFGVEE